MSKLITETNPYNGSETHYFTWAGKAMSWDGSDNPPRATGLVTVEEIEKDGHEVELGTIECLQWRDDSHMVGYEEVTAMVPAFLAPAALLLGEGE